MLIHEVQHLVHMLNLGGRRWRKRIAILCFDKLQNFGGPCLGLPLQEQGDGLTELQSTLTASHSISQHLTASHSISQHLKPPEPEPKPELAGSHYSRHG